MPRDLEVFLIGKTRETRRVRYVRVLVPCVGTMPSVPHPFLPKGIRVAVLSVFALPY
jgi:hypothetical protein